MFMKKILLVGGAGYIGTVLTDYLLGLGHKVKSLDIFLYKNEYCISEYLNHKNYQSIRGNFCEKNTFSSSHNSFTDTELY